MKLPLLLSGLGVLLNPASQALSARLEFDTMSDPPGPSGNWFDQYVYEYDPATGWSEGELGSGDDWRQPLIFRVVSDDLPPGRSVGVRVDYWVELGIYDVDAYNFGGFTSGQVHTSLLGHDLDGPGTFEIPLSLTVPIGEWTVVDAQFSGMALEIDGLTALDPSRPAGVILSGDGDFRIRSVTITNLGDAGSSLGLLTLAMASMMALRRPGSERARAAISRS